MNLPYNKTIFFSLILLTFLLPLFFIPASTSSFDYHKGLLITVLVAISLFIWIVYSFFKGALIIPRSLLLAVGGFIVATFFVSSFFSEVPLHSLFETGFEIGTASFLLTLFILFFLASVIFQTRSRIFSLYGALFLSSLLVAFIQLSHLLEGFSFFSLGILPNSFSNLIGSPTDFTYFFGSILLLSLMTIEFLPVKRFMVLYILLVVSLFFFLFGARGFPLYMVSIFILFFAVYKIQVSRKVFSVSLFVFVGIMLFAVAGEPVKNVVASVFPGPISVEIRPSWKATFTVGQGVLSEGPLRALLGSGPNTFANQWARFKPAEINATPFWNTNFNTGSGLIPTLVITTGLIGIFWWVIFGGLFLYYGIKAVTTRPRNDHSQYLKISSFVLALYFWILAIVFPVHMVLFAFAFLMTGVFLAVCVQEKIIINRTIFFTNHAQGGLGFTIPLIMIIVSGIAGLYFLTRSLAYSFASNVYFQKGLTVLIEEGKSDAAEEKIAYAARLWPRDIYHRYLAKINLDQLLNVASQNEFSQEEADTQFQAIANLAIGNAKKAVELDTADYRNWYMLGEVYLLLSGFGVQGVLEHARTSIVNAYSLNSTSPVVVLEYARLELALGNREGARSYIENALRMKPDYLDAKFFLSQLEVQE